MPDRDNNDGNAEAVRRVANQLFEAWGEKSKSNWRASAPAWLALVLALCALIWNAAITTQRVAENDRRIGQIESSDLSVRLARIEAKIDLMVRERNGQWPQGERRR